MDLLAELRDLVRRHARPEELRTAVPALRVMAASAPTAPRHLLYEPALVVVLQGAKRTITSNATLDYGAGQCMVCSVELPVASHVVQASEETPFLALGLALSPAAIAALMLETGQAGPAGHAGPLGEVAAQDLPGLDTSALTPDLADALTRLARLLDRPDDVPVLAPLFEREVLWRLLNGPQGAQLRQIGVADSRLARINRAIRAIRARFADALSIDELAAIAAMSVSSFHRHFRAITTMSPLQYQKQVRLQEARARLLARPADIAAVGYGVGYDSASQFSREYSRLFGAPPGRDLARMRAAARAQGTAAA